MLPKKRGVLKLVAQFPDLCLAIQSLNVRTNRLEIVLLRSILIQMQNITFPNSGMRRKQNFEIVFGLKSDTAVLTFSFSFLSAPPPSLSFSHSLEEYLVELVSEKRFLTSKMKFCERFVLCKIDPEKVFGDVLVRKQAFLDNINMDLKRRQN